MLRIRIKNKILLLLLVIFGQSLACSAQSGGENSFQFLEFSACARLTGLGGEQVGFVDEEASLSFSNPAQISHSIERGLSVNYANYLSDISYGYASYAQNVDSIGIFSGGIHFVNYGSFIETDSEGTVLGTFTAAEYVGLISFNLLLSETWSIGASIKPIYSKLEKYSSFAIACDVGATYIFSTNRSSFGIVLKNIGGQITTYYDGASHESLPFDLQIGGTHRLKHAPFRFFATLHDLNRWDLYSSLSSEEESSFTREFFQHVNVGLEFLPGENITARFGYNHQRRSELKLVEAPGLTGFSSGFGVKVRRIIFDYGVAQYYSGSSSHQFSISYLL